MNCREFWLSLSKRQQALDPGQRDHIERCTQCATGWDRQQSLLQGLNQLSDEFRGLEAPERVEARLIEAYRSQLGLAVRPKRSGWFPALTWTAAAAATAGIALLLLGAHPAAPPARQMAARPVELAVAELSADAAVEPMVDEVSGDFIPLPNTQDIEPNEELNLVRVEVPRSAMIALGYAVSADRADERVEADVVLGADGTARAVRFLDE